MIIAEPIVQYWCQACGAGGVGGAHEVDMLAEARAQHAAECAGQEYISEEPVIKVVMACPAEGCVVRSYGADEDEAEGQLELHLEAGDHIVDENG